MAHIHFGTGALGLGLVCTAAARAGLEVTVLNRRASSSAVRCQALLTNKSFEVFDTGTREIESFGIKDFSFLSEASESEKVAIDSPEPLLITTALKKDGINACIKDIANLIKMRLSAQPNKPIVIVAAENAVDSVQLQALIESYFDLFTIRHLRRIADFLPCVVDRICNKPTIVDGNVQVVCESYWNWIISKPKSDKLEHFDFLVESFENIDEVEFVEDIEPYKMRKAIVVNGLHLSTAMFVAYAEEPRIDKFINDSSFGAEVFSSLSQEIAEIFMLWNANSSSSTFHESDIVEYVSDVSRRFSTHPHSSTDAITRFKPTSLVAFFEDYNRKIGQHYIQYGRQISPYGWLPLNLFAIAELIEKEYWI